MVEKILLQSIKQRLGEHYGERLKGVVLFGSEARGEAGEESDVDLLVLLDGPVGLGEELDAIIKCLYPLQLELEFFRPLQALPVDAEKYEARVSPLYETVHEEGIRL